MKDEYLVLRVASMKSSNVGVLGPGGPLSAPFVVDPATLTVEVGAYDRTQANQIALNREVLAIAPVFPVKLIQPLQGAPAGLQPGETDWGISAVGAATSPFTGDGVVVAVLDTGIDASHPAFSGVTLIQKNFTDAPHVDESGHGTHCAGTIFGHDVLGRRIGLVRGVTKALIGKVLAPGSGQTPQIVRAIQWATNEGASVISMSLGLDFPGFQKHLMEHWGFPAELATSRALEAYVANKVTPSTVEPGAPVRAALKSG